MAKVLSRWVFVLALLVPVAACETVEPPAPLPQLTFENLKPIPLKVAQVELADEYVSPLDGPHVEGTVPVSPATAMKAWAARRLVAGGGNGVARLVIKTASMTATPLKLTSGLKGAFTDEQSERYDVDVKAELRIYDGGGAMGAAYVIAEASLSRTIPEKSTINDRRRVQFEVVEAVMADFDKEMEKTMRAHLARWMP